MPGIASTALSDTVIPIVSVLAALIIGSLTVWVTYAVGFPRRRLFYSQVALAPLVRVSRKDFGQLEIKHEGKVIEHPHILEIAIASQGRRDIPSAAFDQGKAIQFDTHSQIISILQVTSEPSEVAPPKISPNGSFLEIGPSLIHKRAKISVGLLIDGEQPYLTCQGSLENVPISKRSRPIPQDPVVAMTGMAAGLTSAAIAMSIFWVLIASTSFGPPSSDSPHTVAFQAFAGVSISLIATAFLGWGFTAIIYITRKRRIEKEAHDSQ